MFEKMMRDIRYGVRKMIKNRLFTVLVIVTLSCAIGMITAVFSVISALLLSPLPYNTPDELVQIENNFKPLNLEHLPVSVPEFADFQKQTQAFSNVAIFTSWEMNLGTLRGNDARRLPGAMVSASLFDVLGVAPVSGRLLRPEDNHQGANTVAVVSYDFWQHLFNGDPSLVGQSVVLDGVSYSIVGIMPKGFYFPDRDTQLWAPIAFKPTDFAETDRGSRSYQLYGRLRPGLSVNQARAAMTTFASELSLQHPQDYPGNGLSISVTSLQEEFVGDARLPLIILLIASTLVLFIACANVANLMLARAATWRKEVDVRIALGASRGRMVSQFLTESLMLSLLAGALGIGLAHFAKDVIIATAGANIVHPEDVSIDVRVLGFTFVLCVLSGVILGLAPALQVYKKRLYESLSENASTAGRVQERSRDFLIVAEVCVSLVLLICAGIMIKSLYRLQTVDTGFNPSNVLTMKLYLPVGKYDDAQRAAFYTELLRRVNEHQGVQSAGVINQLPLAGGSNDRTFLIEGRQGESAQPDVEIRNISPEYFKAMGISVVKGRPFSAQDDAKAPKVLIVNQAMAKKYWQGEDALGKRMAYFAGPGETPEWRQIVGIAGDVRHFGLNTEPKPEVYVPQLQHPRAFMNLVVRTASDPLALVSGLRRDVRDLDKNQAVYDIKTMDSVVADSITMQRLSAILLGSFAGFALFLAAIGLHGVLSYLVSQRTRELGLRMALGAQRSDVFMLIMKKGLVLVMIGMFLGLAGALVVTRLLASLVYGVSTNDPLIFVMVPLVLIAVSIIGCVRPATAALNMDPVVALKHE